MKLSVSHKNFGSTPVGLAQLYTLQNANGMQVKITDFGGIVTSIIVPDKNGNFDDVALGFDNIGQYTETHPYFGAIIGRYGNRIAKGQFNLEGVKYTLPTNQSGHTLHGGDVGFDKLLFKSKAIEDENFVGVELKGESPDMDQGFPGNLSLVIKYTLNNQNELSISYEATTDKTTVVNLTNHTYFNLDGAGNGDILNHELTMAADKITLVDSTIIPTGNIQNIVGTSMDFTRTNKIGKGIDDLSNDQIAKGGGYDHNYIFTIHDGQLKKQATVYSPNSGRVLEVLTTEPAVQFYTGNFLNGIIGKNKKKYTYRSGFCLETQHYPDSPNHPHFPSTVLRPNEKYESNTIYRFSIK